MVELTGEYKVADVMRHLPDGAYTRETLLKSAGIGEAELNVYLGTLKTLGVVNVVMDGNSEMYKYVKNAEFEKQLDTLMDIKPKEAPAKKGKSD